jgi:hypothetical protein
MRHLCEFYPRQNGGASKPRGAARPSAESTAAAAPARRGSRREPDNAGHGCVTTRLKVCASKSSYPDERTDCMTGGKEYEDGDTAMASESRGDHPPVGKPRPAVFRALGTREPPARLEIDGHTYRRKRIFKHDSWAASALYDGPHQQVVCKFNREQPLLGLPMRWLGRLLARREADLLRMLEDVALVPQACGEIHVDGRPLPTAAGHQFVPGGPLRRHQRVPDAFFRQLGQLLDELHRRRIAYVDLHKRENILVGDDGLPYLFDFQISLRLPAIWPASLMFQLLADSDRYHLAKHLLNHRPDLCQPQDTALVTRRPWWIRLHRLVATPFRKLRRRLLVRIGIRRGRGMAETECFPEEGLRLPIASACRNADHVHPDRAAELPAWRPAA